MRLYRLRCTAVPTSSIYRVLLLTNRRTCHPCKAAPLQCGLRIRSRKRRGCWLCRCSHRLFFRCIQSFVRRLLFILCVRNFTLLNLSLSLMATRQPRHSITYRCDDRAGRNSTTIPDDMPPLPFPPRRTCSRSPTSWLKSERTPGFVGSGCSNVIESMKIDSSCADSE
jgi:hypothetical protein